MRNKHLAEMEEANRVIDDWDDEKYLIWSNEHQLWWNPNRMGYTKDYKKAGLYSRKEAIGICLCNYHPWFNLELNALNPQEIMVQYNIVSEMENAT